jgi:hypothetical protein
VDAEKRLSQTVKDFARLVDIYWLLPAVFSLYICSTA